MNKKYIVFIVAGILLVFASVLAYLISGNTVDVLQPAGEIGEKQRDLIYFAVGLSVIVVVPVYIMTIAFAYKYRHTNKSAKYRPEWDHNWLAETLWWGIPTVLILILSVVTWKSSHDLDPFKAIASDKKPLTIQVVALDWKWLFLYPEQQIATVNSFTIPKDQPVKFEITADAPMNSFWIPQLGGQIYAMSGMSTHLNLIAEQTGTFRGSSANISGRGFADMNFTASAVPAESFGDWVKLVKQSPNQMTASKYKELAKPYVARTPSYYSGYQPGLYSAILQKYMPYGHHLAEGTVRQDYHL